MCFNQDLSLSIIFRVIFLLSLKTNKNFKNKSHKMKYNTFMSHYKVYYLVNYKLSVILKSVDL